jgi:multidrug efflux pump subunit AcrB
MASTLGSLLFFRLETGFLPDMDEGGYVIDYWTPPGASLQESDRMVRRIEDVLKKTPEVASFNRRTGSEMGMFATEQNRGGVRRHCFFGSSSHGQPAHCSFICCPSICLWVNFAR